MQNKTFLYQVIYEDLKRQMMTGGLRPEDKLPSEEEMAQTYSVSKITVKKALELLKEEGLINRVQGQGTFVAVPEAHREEPEPKPVENKIIGLVLEHVSSPFGLDMMYRMIQLLDERGYKLCIRFTFGDINKETEEINDLLRLNVAGMIIMPCHDSHYNMTILRLILEHFPVVLVDKRMHGLPIYSVCTDGREAMRYLIHHLKERGCRNTAILTIDPASTTSLGDRAEGFYKGLEEAGLTCAGECILPRRTGNMLCSKPEIEYVKEIGEYLDSLDELPESMVCTEYAIGRALYAAAEERGLKVGVDFKACCIDENALATRGSFFTHMHQDEDKIAEETVHLLLDLLNGKHPHQQDVRVPAKFFQGETT